MGAKNKLSEGLIESLIKIAEEPGKLGTEKKLEMLMSDPNIRDFFSNEEPEEVSENDLGDPLEPGERAWKKSPPMGVLGDDQPYANTSDNILVPRLVQLLKLSILATDFNKVRRTWNVTTCQDILHSVYNLRKSLESTLETGYIYYPNDNRLLSIEKLIRNVLRPFAIEWHGSLFYNTQCSGSEMRSEAIQGQEMTNYRLKLFQNDVLEIQQTVFETIKELDPNWEV